MWRTRVGCLSQEYPIAADAAGEGAGAAATLQEICSILNHIRARLPTCRLKMACPRVLWADGRRSPRRGFGLFGGRHSACACTVAFQERPVPCPAAHVCPRTSAAVRDNLGRRVFSQNSGAVQHSGDFFGAIARHEVRVERQTRRGPAATMAAETTEWKTQ